MLASAIPRRYKRAHPTRGPRPLAIPVVPADAKSGGTYGSAAVQTGECHAARVFDAPAIGGWRPFRPSVPPLEPEDGAIHLRNPQQYPYHRPRPDGADAAPRPGSGQRYGRARRAHPVRRDQTPSAGRDRRRGQALGAILRQLAMARRHADELEDDLAFDSSAAQARRDARLRPG